MCRLACPVSGASGRETLIPQAKMDTLNQLRRGRVPWTEASSEPLWGCTGCRHCTTYCEHDNEPGLVLFSGRAEATARGVGHPGLVDYPDRFRKREQRLVGQLREHVPADRRDPDAAVTFFPGCDAIDKAPETITAGLSLFDAVADDRVQVADVGRACAGYPLLAAGYPDMFRWHATKLASELKRCRTAVVGCSACVYTMRAQYAAEGVHLSTEIVSTAEFLAERTERIPRTEPPKPVYYHDPCYLARYVGVVEAPRRVLSQVAEVREFAWSGTDTECCGGGGMLPKTMPDTADAMAGRRLREIASRGGGTVVTSCGTCAYMLARNAPRGVQVRDLHDFVDEAIGAKTTTDQSGGRKSPRSSP